MNFGTKCFIVTKIRVEHFEKIVKSPHFLNLTSIN